MAKDFAAVNRMELEAGLATVGNGKDELVSKFVKAWENQTARRALKGGTGISMALTLAACGGGSDDTSTPAAPTTPTANLIDFVTDGITEISGVDPVVVIPNPTAGADDLSTTIGAGGTGTLTLQFADADDTVALAAASDLTGYTTLAIVSGTVDVTAVSLAGITSITVSSGVVLTAEQFLGLSGGVTGGSAQSSVEVVVSTAAEAADVIAAAASLSGTFAAAGITITAAAGSGITAAQAAAFTDDLVAAIEAVELVEALPAAIQAIEAADAAQAAFVEVAMANADVEAENAAAADFVDVDVNIDNALVTIEGNINADLPAGFVTAFDGTNGAAVAAEFTAELADLAVAKTDASDALAAIDAQLVVLSDAEVAAEAALVAAQAAQATAAGAVDTAITAAEGEGAAVLAWDEVAGTLTSDADGAGAVNDPVVIAALNVDGVLTLNAALTLDAVAGTYTVDGATYDVADIQAVVAAANAELAAIEATAEAELARDDAVDATNEAIAAEGAGAGAANVAVTAYIGASQDLASMQADEASFEELLADYNAVLALDEQAADLNAALLDAVVAMEDAAPDGLGVAVLNVADGAGAVDFDGGDLVAEIYGYDEANADTGVIAVADFSTTADDYIYMGAGVYTLVEMGADETIADSLGSVSSLEIIAEETVAGVTLWVEQIATAGNGTTASDMIQVQIAGLDLADLSFDAANGILTAEATIA